MVAVLKQMPAPLLIAASVVPTAVKEAASLKQLVRRQLPLGQVIAPIEQVLT
jgi:hypothetical protein